nr:nucleotide-binding alpha-beta plait domain-containing protein [Tanacetum cinerariifolium]
ILLFSSAWRFRLLGDKMVAISKEDEVQKISTSIFVTNFPEYAKANDLWNVCKQYGYVVDAFIPGRRSKKGKAKSTEDCEPVMVLDEACLNHQEYSLELLGKVKEFSILANVKVVLGSEGFSDIELNYMGGLWIMIGFKSEDTKEKFQSCVGAVSWFSQIIQASKEFDIDERITWVDIEGIPLKLWSKNTFNRIETKWGKILYMENLDVGCFHSKRICILTTGKSNIFESFKIIHQGKSYWVRAKETTGWFLEFDEQNKDNSDSKDEQFVGTIKDDFGGSDGEMEGENNVSVVSDTVREEENVKNTEKSNNTESLQYPPGFTPCDVKAAGLDKNTTRIYESNGVGGEKLDSVSVGSRNCKKVDIKRTKGSLLTVMEELIKVGKTMGYNMEGCMKN